MIHGFDIFAAGFICLFLVVGIKRGFITEIFRLLAMIGGLAAAILFYRPVYSHLPFFKAPDNVKLLIAFLLVYVVVLLSLLLAGWGIRKLVQLSMLGWLDRLGGALIGILKAAIILWIFTLSVNALPDSSMKRGFRTSKTIAWINKIPLPVNLLKLDQTRKTMEKFIDKTAIKPAEKLKKKIEEVKADVDSAKGRK